MNELNDRQKVLYDFLEKQGDQWTTQKDIAYALFNWYRFYESEGFHDSNARITMTKDIRAINENDTIQKIIISSSNGIKLATEEEFEKYIKKQYISIFKRLKRIRQKERKGLLNGQTRIVFASERDVVEAFLNE